MNCPFCGKEIDEATAREKCQHCTLFGGCRNLRCPNCGYEVPEEPGFVKWLRKKSGKGDHGHERTDRSAH